MISNDYIFKYENNPNTKFVKYSDEYIKKNFSTKKYKIDKHFLEYLNQFNHLWEEEKYIYNYMITPLKNLLMRLEYMERPSSEHNALFFNLTQPYLLDNMWRLMNSQNMIKTLYGDTGSGKSYLGLEENHFNTLFLNKVAGLDVGFDVSNVCFSRQEILNKVPVLKRGESIQFDEDNEGILGVGSFSSKSFVSRFEKTLRSMSKNFYNLNPDINAHNEHYIVKAGGINDEFETNKFIFRERDSVFYGFGLMPMFHDNLFRKLINNYEVKKKKFQVDLENQRGDDARTNRMLEMAVNLICEYGLRYDSKSTFKMLIANKFKMSITDSNQLFNLMVFLLDSRTNVFLDYKERIKEFIVVKGEKK